MPAVDQQWSERIEAGGAKAPSPTPPTPPKPEKTPAKKEK